MKMFSDCSGECVVCFYSFMRCLSGHGDDDFSPASKEQLIKILDTKKWAGNEDKRDLTEEELNYVKGYLLMKYNYDYESK